MRGIKVCAFIFLFVILISVVQQQIVGANEAKSEINTYTVVNITAEVPSDFMEDIIITLREENSNDLTTYPLTVANQYKGKLKVIGNNNYAVNISFNDSEKYKSNLEEHYNISGDEYELTFILTPITYSAEVNISSADESATETNTDTHGEEEETDAIDQNTRIATAESVLNNYLEKVAIMQDNENFASFLALYSGEMFRKYYLESDLLNTEEKWEEMGNIERFNYYITFIFPSTLMKNYNYDREEDFIDELDSVETLLSAIPDGNIVYDAIAEVWRWHYQYWNSTGTFFAFYNYYDGTNADTPIPTQSEVKQQEVEDKEKDAITNDVIAESNDNDLNKDSTDDEEIETTNEKNINKWKALLISLKNNLVAIISMGGIGIALLIGYIRTKKKKSNEL